MKANQLLFALFLLLSAAVFQLPAKQNETDRKQFEKVKAKAEAGDANSELELGLRYFNGEGVTKNKVEAVKWYLKAAEQNNHFAQYNLGNLYYNGDGVVKDYAEAVKWYRKAAEQNDVRAQSDLGLCYYFGNGVVKDEVEAYKWWLLAAGQGEERAKHNMVAIENKLTR
jgi:TPR repeat protein